MTSFGEVKKYILCSELPLKTAQDGPNPPVVHLQ